MWLFVILSTVVTATVYWLFMSPYSQVFGSFPYKAAQNQKLVALTFDDGPNEPYTSEIVSFLNSKKIKATFFQVGRCVERYPKSTIAMDKAGHIIGNHSLSHKFFKYFTQPTFRREIQASQMILTNVLGKTPALFRPPWLWHHPLLFRTLRQSSLQPVSGEFCHFFEILQPNAARIAKRTLARVKPGSIIIFHDGYNAKRANRSQTVKAIKITVNGLLDQGYQFVTVSELLNIPAYK